MSTVHTNGFVEDNGLENAESRLDSAMIKRSVSATARYGRYIISIRILEIGAKVYGVAMTKDMLYRLTRNYHEDPQTLKRY